MSDDSQRPIIVKRIKKSAHGHHGGAWKIAYADFVTAMMAFFLLMWLLGSTAKGDLNGIAEYFKTPMKVAMQGGSGSGESSSIIKGGGNDLSRKEGQIRKTMDPAVKKPNDLQAAKTEFVKQEMQKLQGLKEKLEKAIETNPALKQFKNQILIDITSEGLRIQIVDEKNRPMFDLGSAHMKNYTVQVLQEIGKMLNEVPNKISLSGHTDATPYSSGEKGYSNWELSVDRANSSRRELIAGGMDEGKMLRVVGLSSAVMLDPNDPYNPINRRIALIVLNKETEEAISGGGKPLEVSNKQEATTVMDGAPKVIAKENPGASTAEGNKH
ncbi:MAG: flagellar motor protein MotB [Betaproteobacteria bacterium]|nr:flagellar motor protein MotB [Betaproteobacteria bacterium]